MATEKKKANGDDLKIRRAKQFGELEKAIADLTEKVRIIRSKEERLKILQSVSLGLYEELDKLAKKAPADSVTDLVLEQTNDVIREARELASEDTFMQRYHEFVPAGDNPEQRDVLVVLRQVRQGLSRFAPQVEPRKDWLQTVLKDAQGVQVAVSLCHEGQSKITKGDLSKRDVSVMDQWYITKDYMAVFDFDRLDRIQIAKYYNI